MKRVIRILDVCCGAGGVAKGYYDAFTEAGYEVEITGVDIKPQKHYPYHFVQGDALTFPFDGYDFRHASPPCQMFSQSWTLNKRSHPDIVAQVRDRLRQYPEPYIIENVPGAPLISPVLLCGSMFGLGVKRHRLFESNVYLFSARPCPANHGEYVTIFGHDVRPRCPGRGKKGPQGSLPIAVGRAAMGIDWMTRDELAQAIPPAYTQFLGRQIIAAIEYQQTA